MYPTIYKDNRLEVVDKSIPSLDVYVVIRFVVAATKTTKTSVHLHTKQRERWRDGRVRRNTSRNNTSSTNTITYAAEDDVRLYAKPGGQ